MSTVALDTLPCQPWVTGADVGAVCGGLTGSATAVLDAYAVEASELLFEISGRQFNGGCQTTIRPCRRACSCWGGLDIISGGILSPGAYPEAWGYGLGFMWGGAGWINDAGNPCGCGFLQEVELAGYPVTAVTEVKIDGAVVDPSKYRLDENRFLVHLRDPAHPDQVVGWPSCQILDLDDTEPGTWAVTYTYGTAPPTAGQAAAKQLACELYRNDSGQPCKLPSGTSRVNRQGIQIDRVLLNWLKGQSTGLVHVDSFLTAYNPAGLRRRPSVFSPDLPQFGRHVGQ